MAKRKDTIQELMRAVPATSSPEQAKERNSPSRATRGNAIETTEARTKSKNEAHFIGAVGATASLDELSDQHGDVTQATGPEMKTRKKDMHQLSVYLEPSLYNRLRECAHVQRTKMHPIVVEGILLALAKREGQRD